MLSIKIRRLTFVIILSIALSACGGGGSSGNTTTPNSETNTSPTATAVTIVDDNGGVALVGENLTGSYTYNDADADLEGTSTFRWLRNDVAISGATASTYTLVAADSEQSITFEVTPVAVTGVATGTAVVSTTIIIGNDAPVASSVTIVDDNGGAIYAYDTLTGNYSYSDTEGNLEGTSTFRWLRNDVAISGATASTYTLVSADENQIITFEVTPVAATGTITGLAIPSTGVIALHSPAFITTWKTDNAGISANDTILISTNNTVADYSVDWGDGVVEHNQTGDVTHTYSVIGTYTVKITGNFPRIYFYNNQPGAALDSPKLLTVENWGDISWTTMANAFKGCSNLVLNATDVPNLSNVTSMYRMFSFASGFNADLSAWDTSAVRNMQSMFDYASAFNGDVSTWDTSSVTNMSYMFSYASAFNGDISTWDTSLVTDMQYMFMTASAFNGDLSAWNTAAVTTMEGMFGSASASAFNGDLSAWNTAAVLNMSYMFYGASAFTNHDLSGWNVSSLPTHVAFLTSAGTGNTEPVW